MGGWAALEPDRRCHGAVWRIQHGDGSSAAGRSRVPWRRLPPLLSLGPSHTLPGTESTEHVLRRSDRAPAHRWTGCVARTRSHIRRRRAYRVVWVTPERVL